MLSCLHRLETLLGHLVPPSECYFSAFSVAGAGVREIVPFTQSRIFVVSYVIVAEGTTTIAWGGGNAQQFKTLPGTGLNGGRLALTTNTGVSASCPWPGFLFATDPGDALMLNVGQAQTVDGHVSYYTGDLLRSRT